MIKATTLLLCSSILALSNALALSAGQGRSNLVIDGSFEMVKSFFQQNVQSGNWTFEGEAVPTEDDDAEYCNGGKAYGCTPYGIAMASFFKVGDQPKPTGRVYQHVSGLRGGSFSMNYAYRPYAVPEGQNCSYTTTLGKQVLDVLTIPADTPYASGWMNRSFTFTPAKSSGDLAFNFACGRGPKGGKSFQLDLDNIVLTRGS